MGTNRRQFIRTTAVAGAAMALGTGMHPRDVTAQTMSGAPSARSFPHGTAPRRIRLLILGGTGFIGPHQVR